MCWYFKKNIVLCGKTKQYVYTTMAIWVNCFSSSKWDTLRGEDFIDICLAYPPSRVTDLK